MARKILECLDLPARAPPLGLMSDESAGPEAWDEVVPWAFDQTSPDGDDTA